MAKIYLSAAQLINEKPFALLVPRSYQPNMPESFLSGKVQPFLKYDSPDEPQRAMYPIKYMIDMCDMQIRFTILKDEDVCDIFDVIDDYLDSIREDINLGDPGIIAYARRVLNFRAELYKKFFYVCNKHPQYKNRYFQNGKDNRCFSTYMAMVSLSNDAGGREVDADPIFMMRYPPVTLPEPTAKPVDPLATDRKPKHEFNRGLARDDDDESMAVVDLFMKK